MPIVRSPPKAIKAEPQWGYNSGIVSSTSGYETLYERNSEHTT